MIKLFFLIFLFDLLLYALETFVHSHLIGRNIPIQHNPPAASIIMLAIILITRAIIMLSIPLPAFIPINQLGEMEINQVLPWLPLKLIASSLLSGLGIRTLIHDPLLNLLRGLPLDYLGDGVDDSATDASLKSIHKNLGIPAAYVRFIVATACFIISILILEI